RGGPRDRADLARAASAAVRLRHAPRAAPARDRRAHQRRAAPAHEADRRADQHGARWARGRERPLRRAREPAHRRGRAGRLPPGAADGLAAAHARQRRAHAARGRLGHGLGGRDGPVLRGVDPGGGAGWRASVGAAAESGSGGRGPDASTSRLGLSALARGRWPVDPATVVSGARLLARLPGFLRRPVDADDARRTLARRLAARDAGFLELVRRTVYAHAATPYARLLRHAGCAYAD